MGRLLLKSRVPCECFVVLARKGFSNSPSRSLSTLTILLEEVPLLVRPFHPQLTRTMIKSVTDPSSISVRNRAAAGLGELMKHQVSVKFG